MRLQLVHHTGSHHQSVGRTDYRAVTLDEEGNDIVPGETAATNKRRGKVKVHDTMVAVTNGPAAVRPGGVGGWGYTYDANKLEYLTEASLGHGSQSREGKRLEDDMNRRTVAAAITVKDGSRKVEDDTRINMRPCYPTMRAMANPAFNLMQSLRNSDIALGPNVLTNNFSFDGTQLKHFHMMG